MSQERASVIFFDIGDTLASARLENGGNRLVLDVLPGVVSVLSELRNNAIQIGVISNTPENFTKDMMKESLQEAGLFDFFSPELLIYSSVLGVSKNSVVIFLFAADRAQLAHERAQCMFVGENPQERDYASEADFQVASTPSEALALVLDIDP